MPPPPVLFTSHARSRGVDRLRSDEQEGDG